VFDVGVDFDACVGFLIDQGYVLVDFVGSPGEYSTRGGIVDVFPFTSISPYRLNFLDGIATVTRVDVETQLTVGGVIKNFMLSSISNNVPVSLKEVSLDRFLPLRYNGVDELHIGFGDSVSKQICLNIVTFRQFLDLDQALFTSISSVEGLVSVGFFDDEKNLFLPSWFINRGHNKKDKRHFDEKVVPFEMSFIFFIMPPIYKPGRKKKIFFIIKKPNRNQSFDRGNRSKKRLI
jgi:hypothetical protein